MSEPHKILGQDAPEDPWEEMKMLRERIERLAKRLSVIRSIITANQYGFTDKESLSLIFYVLAVASSKELDEIQERMQGIINTGVEEANKRL